jgi:hypothetical protein
MAEMAHFHSFADFPSFPKLFIGRERAGIFDGGHCLIWELGGVAMRLNNCTDKLSDMICGSNQPDSQRSPAAGQLPTSEKHAGPNKQIFGSWPTETSRRRQQPLADATGWHQT